MAVLLAWVQFNGAEPEEKIWAEMLRRAQVRCLFAGIEQRGPGFRLFAAKAREAEDACLLKLDPGTGRAVPTSSSVACLQAAAVGAATSAGQHVGQPASAADWLLLDRARGSEAEAKREQLEWTPSLLQDGTPCAAIQLQLNPRQLTLWRDPLGQRSLVYARVPGGVIVACGEHVLQAHPDISDAYDEDFLAAYFEYLSPPHEASIYRDIRTLKRGESLVFAGNQTRSAQLQIAPDFSWRGQSDDWIVARFRELFTAAVSRACLGAQRVGISLSAGMDSSSVAAVALRLPKELTGGLVGVTYGFDNWPEIDERARVQAAFAGQDITLVGFAADQLQPLSDPALRPICPDTPHTSIYQEFKEVAYGHFRAHSVDVWLTGNLGDHLFASSADWLIDAIRERRWSALRLNLGHLLRNQRAGELWRDRALRRCLRWMLGLPGPGWGRLPALKPWWRKRVYDRLRAELQTYREFPRPRQAMLVLDAFASQAASLTEYYSQRHGMESRSPFRDLALTRYCLSVPADLSKRQYVRKWLLRQAMSGILPELIRSRSKGSDLTPVSALAMTSEKISALARRTQPLSCRFRTHELTVLTNMERWSDAIFTLWRSSL